MTPTQIDHLTALFRNMLTEHATGDYVRAAEVRRELSRHGWSILPMKPKFELISTQEKTSAELHED